MLVNLADVVILVVLVAARGWVVLAFGVVGVILGEALARVLTRTLMIGST